MTIASSNGSNGLHSGSKLEGRKITNSTKEGRVTTRPDRSSHNSGEAYIEAESEPAKAAMMDAVRTILQSVGEDPEREGLLKTPKRVAEAMQFLNSRL